VTRVPQSAGANMAIRRRLGRSRGARAA
jgi:hypothetical protein